MDNSADELSSHSTIPVCGLSEQANSRGTTSVFAEDHNSLMDPGEPGLNPESQNQDRDNDEQEDEARG